MWVWCVACGVVCGVSCVGVGCVVRNAVVVVFVCLLLCGGVSSFRCWLSVLSSMNSLLCGEKRDLTHVNDGSVLNDFCKRTQITPQEIHFHDDFNSCQNIGVNEKERK